MMKRIGFMGVLFALFATSAALAASSLEKDVLIVGTSASYPPYESRNEKGEFVGFDIDLTEIIAQKLNKKIEWLDMSFESVIPSLMTGKVDLAASSLAATEERAKRVNFSSPYEISSSAFVTKPENPPKTVEDLTGKTVAVEIGSLQEVFLRALGTVEVKTFQSVDDCIRDVVTDRAVATLLDIPVAKKYMQVKEFAGKIIIAFTYKSKIVGGDKAIAIPKNDPELTAAVSKVIDEMTANGELDALRAKWFGD